MEGERVERRRERREGGREGGSIIILLTLSCSFLPPPALVAETAHQE